MVIKLESWKLLRLNDKSLQDISKKLFIKTYHMKTIGLIGGMSWESSAVYYKLINERLKTLLGGHHSAKSVMVSVDFSEIELLQRKNDWNKLNKLMVNAALQLERANADLIILCTNTMHLCTEEIVKNTSIPFIHIAEATGVEIKKKPITKVGLLGTKFTMEKDFYKKIISDMGIEVITPNQNDRTIVHQIIFNELVHGKITEESKEEYKTIIKKLENNGAQGVILGCTEIPLLIKPDDIDIPVFDTTKIHVESAIKWALQ